MWRAAKEADKRHGGMTWSFRER